MFTAFHSFCQQKAFKAEVYGNGQPIILIPDYACSGDLWKATVDNLKDRYQLHVITIGGFAGVLPIDTPILKTVKNELIKYVKENHLNQPVLIGHGLGAFMSLWMASEEPNLFSKILCVDGVPFLPAMTNPSLNEDQAKKYFNNGDNVINKLQNTPDKAFEETQFKSMLTMVSDSAHARLITKWSLESDRKTLGYTYVEMNTTDLRDDIAKIKIPVLILGSTYQTKEASLKTLNQQFSLLTNKTIIIAPTKHFIMYDDPLWFREQVKNFLINGLKN